VSPIVSCRVLSCLRACVGTAGCPGDISAKSSAALFPFPFSIGDLSLSLVRIYVPSPLCGHIKVKSKWNQCESEVTSLWKFSEIAKKPK